MGREVRCSAVVNGRSAKGKVFLETDELIFRGDPRVAIPYKNMSRVHAEQGRLTIVHPGGTAIFDLGGEAERWARAIRNPKPLLDKLGVKGHHSVVLSRITDEDFVEQIRHRAERVSTRARPDADIIFFGADKRADLARLRDLKGYLKPDGALWVVRPKGGGPITESDVMAGGKEAGLVDVKVVRFSATHTAEKFVLRLADRR